MSHNPDAKGRVQRKQTLISCFIFLALLIYQAVDVEAFDVVIVEGAGFTIYEDVIEGFKRACDCNVKKVIVLDNGLKDIRQEIQKEQPDMILTIGQEALTKTREQTNLPITYLMVLNPEPLIEGRDDISGVSMSISPEKKLNAFLDIFPTTREIGVLYNPDESESYVRRARYAAQTRGVGLVEHPLRDPKDVINVLDTMKDKIDALWVMPSKTLSDIETMEIISFFSMNNRVPVLSYTDWHLKIGAAVVLNVDPYEMGVQGAQVARTNHKGLSARSKDIRNSSVSDVRYARVSINQGVIKKMEIAINEKYRNKASTRIYLIGRR
ncbi:MAG: hypothetical protein HQL06_15550 [Nitrospirae bacterium]|nr:hypothetical protein [Nitrospirota bacterium]